MSATLPFVPRAIIIGGSTSGVLVGALLRRRGWHIDVFERSPAELAGRGAGIVCHNELFHSLGESGAGTDAIGVNVTERIAFDDNGSIVGRLVFPQIVTSWDRLYQLVRKMVPDSQYHLDHALVDVEQDAQSVRATFANGRQAVGELLIGADGFRSTVRQQFLPEISPRYAGYAIWRGLADEARLRPDIKNLVFERFAFHLPAGNEILGYPIAGAGNDLRVGHRRYNWVWYRKISEVELEDMLTDDNGCHHAMGIPPALIRDAVVARMREASRTTVSPPLRHVLDRIERPFFTPIYDLLSPQFAFGRVALIGDAAVVARPHVGYGTTKAAGDALSLATAVGNGGDDVAAALTRYHADRYDVGEQCFYRGQQLGAWISGAPPRTDRERREYAELHSTDGILRHVASGEFLRTYTSQR
jgi:2-polyprenyl-6-methoxyphenol hydroxylase-like FAD-dependent oxidoreductase